MTRWPEHGWPQQAPTVPGSSGTAVRVLGGRFLGPAFRPRQNRKVDLEGVSPFQVKYSVILSYQAREHLPGDTVATILVAEVKSTGSIPGPTPTSSRAASAYKELRHPRGSLLTTSRDSGSFLAGINVKSELHDFKKRTRNRNLINLGVSHDFEFKIPRNVTCAFPPKGFFLKIIKEKAWRPR